MDFVKKKPFFVGIDSDGTVFDSMTIKHTGSFIPAAIEVFGLEKYADRFKEIAERINLYSMDRGINRFPGLYMSFKELKEAGCDFDERLEDFEEFLNSGLPLSNAGLEKWNAEHPSDFNKKVMQWSKLGDKYFEEQTKNIPPFQGVTETVEYMAKSADIMVVSSASYDGLLKDWSNAGLTKSVDFIAGQEFGKKSAQLLFAKEHGYDGKQMLMVGDAPGDYEAAKKAGARFYPIIPGNETECWNSLKSTYFEMFTAGNYTESVENELYNKFIKFLKGGKNA
ncbi:MAG: HAD family hydrolase [Acutalibacteraceae bacterium]|jgi:phosphoglycolate phosphatase-like HAD superfamily hydrolase